MKRGIPALGAKLVYIDNEILVRVEERHVGRESRSQSAQVDPNNIGRIAGQFAHCLQWTKDSLVNKLEGQGKSRFEADHSKGGVIELHILLYGTVRRMISSYGVDGAIGETLTNRG